MIDDALDTIKTNPDPAARKAAAETINRELRRAGLQLVADAGRCGAMITQPYVNGVQANVLPDGREGLGLAFAGRHQINQIWCDDGNCG